MAAQVAAAPAPASSVLEGEEKPMSEQDVIRIFKNFKRDAQMIISKISELEYEVGEHELELSEALHLAEPFRQCACVCRPASEGKVDE